MIQRIYLIAVFLLLGATYSSAQDLSGLFNQLKTATTTDSKIRLCHGIADIYHQKGVYKKEIEYLEQAYTLGKGNPQLHQATLNKLGNVYATLSSYNKAIDYYQELFKMQQSGDLNQATLTQKKIGTLYQQSGNYDQAIETNKSILAHYTKSEDWHEIAKTLNNLGYLSKKKNDQAQALAYFEKAYEALKYTPNLNPTTESSLLINIGLAHAKLGEFSEADKHFNRNLAIQQTEGNRASIAQAYNFIGGNHYISSDNKNAIAAVKRAIDEAKASNADDVLATSYRLLSDIYQQEGEFKESKRYYQLAQELKASLEKKEQEQQQALLEEEITAEKEESDFNLLFAEKEKQALALKQLELEKEQQQKDMALQAKNLEILQNKQALSEANLKTEQLEKEKVRQALALTQKQLEAEKRDQAIANLQKEKALQEANLKQKEAEEREKEKAIELLQKEKELQQQQLDKEATFRLYSYAILGLILLVLGVIIYGYIQKQKAAKVLKKQAGEISDKNNELQYKNNQLISTEEELRQNMEELQAIQEQLESQNSKLSSTYAELKYKNTVLTDSIRYAETIQTAILPTPDSIHQDFPEHALIFLPKDVVSGDFYWKSTVGNKVILAVVDCTGHGVPGAFMSMIGASLLDQIVNEKKVTDPAKILSLLHIGVIKALKQQDNANRDGMDLSLCSIDRSRKNGHVQVQFSGAKTTLYYHDQQDLHSIKGVRKSVGGVLRGQKKSFITHELSLPKGTTLFMSSDGLFDLANAERQRFGSPNFQAFISKHHQSTLKEFEHNLLKELHNFQEGTPQRDDITMLAVKL